MSVSANTVDQSLVQEFFALKPPQTIHSPQTKKDTNALLAFNKIDQDAIGNLYFHPAHGYLYTIDKRACCGPFTWHKLQDSSLVHRSPGSWSRPTRELIDSEKIWLDSVELIGTKE